jgi:hypothetical protein
VTANAAVLLAGHAILLILLGFLWIYVPAPGDGKPRCAGTSAENLVLAAYAAGFAVADGLMVAGYLNYFA